MNTDDSTKPARRPWCANGIRYDDYCVVCHKTRDVDNDLDICQRCYGDAPPRRTVR